MIGLLKEDYLNLKKGHSINIVSWKYAPKDLIKELYPGSSFRNFDRLLWELEQTTFLFRNITKRKGNHNNFVVEESWEVIPKDKIHIPKVVGWRYNV